MARDLYFRIASLSDFMDDLDGFTDANGYPRLTRTDTEGNRTLPTAVTQDHTRYDFDYINDLVGVPAELDSDGNITQAAILRGPHMNVRISLMPRGDAAVMQQVIADLEGFFEQFTEADFETPSAMLDRLGLDPQDIKGGLRPTPRATGLIRREETVDGQTQVSRKPAVPKRIFG